MTFDLDTPEYWAHVDHISNRPVFGLSMTVRPMMQELYDNGFHILSAARWTPKMGWSVPEE